MWRLRWVDVRWFVSFGGSLVVNNMINHVNATIDLILGGRLLGANLLGLCSVPRNLMFQVQGMINPVFTRVGFPLIASIQEDRDRVRQVYLKTMNMTASVNAPIYMAFMAFPSEIVISLLGPNWEASAPLLRVLALWGLLRSFGNPVGSLLFGLGHVRLAAYWNGGVLLLTPPAVWLGAHWGATGMAWSIAGMMAVLFVPAWALLVRPSCGAGFIEYFKQIAIPSLCAGLSAVVALWVASYANGPLVRLMMGALVGAVVYVLTTLRLNKEFADAFVRALGRNARAA